RVIALMSDSYLRWLRDVGGAVQGFLALFLIAAGMEVGALVLLLAYRAAADLVPSWLEKTGFVTASFFLVYALFDVVALGRNVIAQAMARGGAAELDELEKKAETMRHRRN